MNDIQDRIMKVLQDEAKQADVLYNKGSMPPYVPPQFLQIITSALDDYFNLEDEDVDDWILSEFGR